MSGPWKFIQPRPRLMSILYFGISGFHPELCTFKPSGFMHPRRNVQTQGAQRTARPTFKRGNELGNTPKDSPAP
jgi:hypothetical protein